MLAPDAPHLRPGDFVKVRGTLSPVHNGQRAIVVAVHRDEQPPRDLVSVEVRYNARGHSTRVDLAGPGELARFDAPWPSRPTTSTPPPAPEPTAVADVSTPYSRRALALGLAGAAALAGVVAVGAPRLLDGNSDAYATSVAGLAQGTAPTTERTPVVSSSATQEPTEDSAEEQGTPAKVVAYAAGTVPVLAVDTTTDPQPVPLAGITAGPDAAAYAAALLDLLPIGTAVAVAEQPDGGSTYLLADGTNVNDQLVAAGVAVETSPP